MLAVLFFACSAQRTVKFSTGRNVYEMDVPSGFKITKHRDDHSFLEFRLHYPDSSTIYITNDYKSGGAFNTFKEKEYRDRVYLMIVLSDTLDLKGTNLGKHWREQKKNDVIAGYFNVSEGKKEEYDQVLATLRKRD